MFQFIESICCLNRELRNIDLHQERFERTRADVFPNAPFMSLIEAIQIPDELSNDKYKVRVIYGKEIESIEFIPYEIKEINTIQLHKIGNEITYEFKYADRWFFDEYIKETGCDDLVLVRANYITDAIYSNLIFFNGIEWHTPTTSLLQGTMRESLLREGKILEKNIKTRDLKNYYSFKRINSMMNFDEAQTFDIQVLLDSL
ncbi:aminotransferase class IV [Faecalibacter macacae]|uniref:Chorismate-binding protein n=1 Tax=Faecalibacter macacae TaxID=1859289 RepID=A0A3L9MHQ9_9FLAO|nr:aminotransferase class IV [Faecalibacter macacae]RLZ12593.1 hypothetical protein EAH69_00060 [Faecalibacter macacae]